MSPRRLKLFRLVIASPGDVERDWRAITAAVEELNRGAARDRGIYIEVSNWRTDAYPAFHAEGPQGHIDEQLRIEDCDVLLALFWTRFGSPVKGAKSGTQHEIERAIRSWKRAGRPQVMVYFKDKPYSPKSQSEIQQWANVRAFRDDFPPQGLYRTYKTTPELEKLLRGDLALLIRNATAGRRAQVTSRTRVPPASRPKVHDSAPQVLLEYEQSFKETTDVGDFTLHNVGKGPAANIRIRCQIPGREQIRFPDVPHINAGKSRTVRPTIQKPGGVSIVFRHRIVDLLDSLWQNSRWKAAAKPGTTKRQIDKLITEPITLPVEVTYYDAGGHKYAAAHVLTYNYFGRHAAVRLKTRAAA